MIVRMMKQSDLPKLRAMAAESGYPYPDPDGPLVEAVMVVADAETDEPLMACAAQRILELYLFSSRFRRPLAAVHALKLLHDAIPAEALRAKGYSEVNAFLPPGICVRFKRRLAKLCKWTDNWQSVTWRF